MASPYVNAVLIEVDASGLQGLTGGHRFNLTLGVKPRNGTVPVMPEDVFDPTGMGLLAATWADSLPGNIESQQSGVGFGGGIGGYIAYVLSRTRGWDSAAAGPLLNNSIDIGGETITAGEQRIEYAGPDFYEGMSPIFRIFVNLAAPWFATGLDWTGVDTEVTWIEKDFQGELVMRYAPARFYPEGRYFESVEVEDLGKIPYVTKDVRVTTTPSEPGTPDEPDTYVYETHVIQKTTFTPS